MNRIEKAQRVFGYTLLLGNKLQMFGDSLMEDFTLKQWFLLIMIQNMEMESPSVNQIAEAMGTSRQNIRKMLSILERKGYVAMKTSETDSRALSVILTEKTKSFMESHEKWGEQIMENMFQDISEEELEVCMRVSEKIFQNIEEAASNE